MALGESGWDYDSWSLAIVVRGVCMSVTVCGRNMKLSERLGVVDGVGEGLKVVLKNGS
jgi:hypothetical protein